MNYLHQFNPVTVTFAIITLVSAGCQNESPQSPIPETPRLTQNKRDNMTVASFVIGKTDFGIEIDESSFEIDTSDPSRPLVTIEIHGNETIFEKLSNDDESEWSWALYAPHFYIREFPAKPTSDASTVTANARLDDIEEYDLAIYMMEHSDIDNVKIEATVDKALKVTGRVNLFGKTHDFEIRWQK